MQIVGLKGTGFTGSGQSRQGKEAEGGIPRAILSDKSRILPASLSLCFSTSCETFSRVFRGRLNLAVGRGILYASDQSTKGDFMNDIETFISARRLAKYAKPTAKEAFAAHLYNSELAESFYQSLSYFEIILRNKIDAVFSKHLGEDWIFNPAYLIGKNADTFYKTQARIANESNKDPKNKNHIISELTFGFWAYLFSPNYRKTFWKAHAGLLKEIFDNAKETLSVGACFERINRIRNYRNKVYHYGSLLTVTDPLNEPAKIHNMVYKLIRDMNANSVLKQIKEIDRFNEEYTKGRRLGFL